MHHGDAAGQVSHLSNLHRRGESRCLAGSHAKTALTNKDGVLSESAEKQCLQLMHVYEVHAQTARMQLAMRPSGCMGHTGNP